MLIGLKAFAEATLAERGAVTSKSGEGSDSLDRTVRRWAVKRKKGLVALDRIRLDRFAEGLCAQILHIGPFSAEGPNIEKLHAFISAQGYTFDGRKQKHHEIYMSDPRRVVPARWKNIIRQPIASD